GKALERRKAAGFLVQVTEIEAPAFALASTVFADDPVEPAFEPAGQIEIGAVDGEHERIIEDRLIEPVRHDHLDAVGLAVAIGALLPFVDPGEAVAPTFRRLAYRGGDSGGLESVECGLQAPIITRR